MLPFHWITLGFGTAAVGVVWAPEELRLWCWLGLLAFYLALCAYASLSQRSSILGPCVTLLDRSDGVALTFDDGPGAGTPAILDLLAERGATATFFCIGKHVEAHTDLVQRMHAAGHGIGNHSYSHTPTLTICGTGTLAADLQRGQDAIEAAIGDRPRIFRPPYGIRTHATANAVQRHGLRVIGWDVGGGDTGGRSTDAIFAAIEANLRPGSIVLLHDHTRDPERALEVTRRVLDLVAARGLSTVAVR